MHTGEDVLLGKTDLSGVVKLLQGAKGSTVDKLRLALLHLLVAEGEWCCGRYPYMYTYASAANSEGASSGTRHWMLGLSVRASPSSIFCSACVHASAAQGFDGASLLQ